MQIWIDADACPKPIKEILFRAAIRTHIPLIVVSNHMLTIPRTPHIKKIQLGAGLDVVDKHIVLHVQPGDLVITADIPFADEVIAKGGLVLNPRGELLSANNIKQRLGLRNMNDLMRGSGMITGGPVPLHTRDIQKFAKQLDIWIAKSNPN
ncbi:MAG: YaiI/YqxD family protein [Legionellaceae bacterium]|nr:YaiI/YqxD family protein [Legionellaceae bacterium]